MVINWKQAVNGNWSQAARWSSNAVPGSGDDVTIGLMGNYTVTITSADVANSLTFDALGASLLETAAGHLSMAGIFTIDNGIVTLGGTNSFGAGVVLNGGMLAVGNGGALGSAATTITGGELLGTANETIANELDLSGDFTIAAAHGTTLNLNPGTGWFLSETAGQNITFGAPGQDGVVVWHTPTASGILPDANQHLYSVDVAGGTLKGGDNTGSPNNFGFLFHYANSTTVEAGATIDLAGFGTVPWPITDLKGDGTITDSGAAATLALTGDFGDFGGTISGPISLDVTGELFLTGTNTYTGTTTIESAIPLHLGNGGATGSIGTGAIVNNGLLIIEHNNAMTLANAISGGGVLQQIGTGTTTINTANTYTGGTLISAGTLAVGHGGALGSGTLHITGGELLGTANETLTNQLIMDSFFTIAAAHGTTLTLNSPSGFALNSTGGATVTFGAPGQDGVVVWHEPAGSAITHSGSFEIEVRAGTFRLGNSAGTLRHDGRTTVDAGARIDVFGFDTAINRLQGLGLVTNSGAAATLTLDHDSTFGGTISGALSLDIFAGLVHTLTGANTYTGSTAIEGTSTLMLGNGGATGSIAGSSPISINSSAILAIDHSNAVTLANAISGTGTLQQIGTGTTTINTANTYTGGTTIAAGTLAVGNDGALGSGTLHITGGELLGRVNETLANPLDMSGIVTIAAAHGTTLNLNGSAGWHLNATGASVTFGAPGQDGVLIWHTPLGSQINNSNDAYPVEVRSGTLRAGDANFDFLLSRSGSMTTVDAGATIDIAGFGTSIVQLHGSGTVTDSGAAATLFLTDAIFQGTLSGALSLDILTTSSLSGLFSFAGGTTVEANAALELDGTFILSSNVGVTAADPSAILVNFGLFEKTGGGGVSTVSTGFETFGKIAVTSGSVQFTGGFFNHGIVQGMLSHNGSIWTVAANAPGQTTFFGGDGANLFKIAAAPTFIDGGAGSDTVELTASMTLASGSLIHVETVQVDNGVTGNLSLLTVGEKIVLASIAGGGATATGTQGADVMVGGAGNDTLNGGLGADSLTGGAGNDTYFVDNAADVVNEAVGGGSDRVLTSVSYALRSGQEIELFTTTNNAGTTAINLTGNTFGQTIQGNAGDNVINGGAGNDTLKSLGGHDTFLFNTALNAATNRDTVFDFDPAQDHIKLAKTVFSTLTGNAGDTLQDSQFYAGAAAHDATDRIIYNSATGAVYYDSDGTGAAAAVQFATLTIHPVLDHTSFLLG